MLLVAATVDRGFRTRLPRRLFGTITKGKGHKYIKRTPTGKPKPKYRYWYKLPESKHIHQSEHLQVGMKFAIGSESGGDKGHYEIKQILDTPQQGKLYRVVHDETGEESWAKESEIRDMLHDQHEDKIKAKRTKLMRDFDAAAKNGTQKQLDRMRGRVMAFADAYLTGGQIRYVRSKLIDIERKYGRRPPARRRPRRQQIKITSIPNQEALYQNPDTRPLGQGAFGQVWYTPGPPPHAIKYGEVKEAEYEMGQQLGNRLGIGPQVYGFKAMAPERHRFMNRPRGKMAMEYLDGTTAEDVWVSADRDSTFVPETDKTPAHYTDEPIKNQILADVFGLARKMHLAGFAHNDMHNNNVMRLTDGTYRVIDYGMVTNNYRDAVAELVGQLKARWVENYYMRGRGMTRALQDDLRRTFRDLEPPTGWLRMDRNDPRLKTFIKGAYDKLGAVFKKHGAKMPKD